MPWQAFVGFQYVGLGAGNYDYWQAECGGWA